MKRWSSKVKASLTSKEVSFMVQVGRELDIAMDRDKIPGMNNTSSRYGGEGEEEDEDEGERKVNR